MASLRQEPKTKKYHILFRYAGRQFRRAIDTTQPKRALAILCRVEETLSLLNSGRLAVPSGVDAGGFILSGGKLETTQVAKKRIRVGELFTEYLNSMEHHSKEQSTRTGEVIHIGHLKRILKSKTEVQSLRVAELQKYITRRALDKWRGKKISPATIKKEITTFRLIWNWAERHELITGVAPVRRLSYPMLDQKLPFMTLEEIRRIIDRSKLTEEEQQEYWETLFLNQNEIEQLLQYAKQLSCVDYIYPMFVFVAHTGARRSELVRSERDDFDFEAGIVRIREKKKSRKQAMTFRHVSMSDLLIETMREWFKKHPSGKQTLCHDFSSSISIHTATASFKQTLKDSEWSIIKGFHTFRHSFASNAAASGVDQGMIDSWMGHQTEEMRNRYRHLFPKQQKSAINKMFPAQKSA